MNHPKQPVVRISWKEAKAFCHWLSERIGQKVSLPTEAQWEWACRAGADTPLYYGDIDTDFSEFGNMADFTIRDLVYDVRDQNPPDLVPRDARYNDKKLVTANVGSYKPNAWGLYDMHGNVWEWTSSTYGPYPYSAGDGHNDISNIGRKTIRGGSWYDRPKRCRSAFRLSYPEWQKVYNVGFRIVIETDGKIKQLVRNK
jgi:formylglycine-generating enzyme required for sulfatase activity